MSHPRYSPRSVLSLSLLCCSLLGPIPRAALLAQTEERPVFPLDPGRSWTYAGNVRWTPPGSAQVQDTMLEWRMEVIERIERVGLQAALLRGHPLDLAWYDEQRSPGIYLLVQVAEAGTYLLEGERAEEALDRLRDRSDPLVGLLLPSELIMGPPPLRSGPRFCETDQVAREDGMYCWFVEAAEILDLGAVDGIPPGEWVAYRLALRTLPDHTVAQVVPGIGWVGFVYGHHGTVSDVDVHLVQVDPPLPGPPGFRHQLSSGLFPLPEGARSVDWALLNDSDLPQRFRVTVFQVGAEGKEELPSGLSGILEPGEMVHNANSIAPDGPFRPGFYFEAVVEVDSREVLPSVSVWSDRGNTGIPGASIPPGAFVELAGPR